MAKLVDKTKLQELAVGLHTKAKALVEAEETRATGVESGLQTAINAINNETTGILAKAKEYTDGKSSDLTTSVEALEAKDTELQAAIDAEVQARTTAINTLNGADTVEGSVDKKIKDALDPVKTDVASLQTEVAANTAAITTGDTQTLTAAKAYADEKITTLVDGAPDAMNTLNELATAIKDHNDVYDAYVNTVSTELAKKVEKEEGKRLIAETEATAFAAKAEVSDVNNALDEAKSYTDTAINNVKSEATTSNQKISALETAVGTAADGETPATGLFKSVADLESKNDDQDTAITAAQTTANKGVSDAAAAQTTANKGVEDAANAQADIDALTAVVGSGGTSGMSKDIKANADAIAAINNETTGILAKAKEYTDGKATDIEANVTANANAISAETARAKAAEKVNSDAIAVLNGDATTSGSVDKKIADTIADYSTTTQMTTMITNVVNSLAAVIEDDKLKLKLGGVSGIILHESTIDMCTSADITEILTSLDA